MCERLEKNYKKKKKKYYVGRKTGRHDTDKS